MVQEGLAKEPDSLLQALCTTIEERESYVQLKEARIKALKNEFEDRDVKDLSLTFSLCGDAQPE
ncbi:hypothetical protein GCM10028791_26960 [Echinicola sediminis]